MVKATGQLAIGESRLSRQRYEVRTLEVIHECDKPDRPFADHIQRQIELVLEDFELLKFY